MREIDRVLIERGVDLLVVAVVVVVMVVMMVVVIVIVIFVRVEVGEL